jgi:hypothetical protein
MVVVSKVGLCAGRLNANAPPWVGLCWLTMPRARRMEVCTFMAERELKNSGAYRKCLERKAAEGKGARLDALGERAARTADCFDELFPLQLQHLSERLRQTSMPEPRMHGIDLAPALDATRSG